ncbi:MAG: hypothetical protein EG826_17955 [Deltaproteobacteria bacterium]|nr:hypothetical protein [Deltaproteobacteria bacterium]
MKKKMFLAQTVLAIFISAALICGISGRAAAHCDTLDGPVIGDARKALAAKDVTPVLKWVKQKDEKAVRAGFVRALGARGKKNEKVAEHQFFETLVRIHRAGEGAPFTGLKPAGEVEPVIIEADKSLESGSPDVLVKEVTDAASAGIKKRFERTQAAYKHKDESVEQGRAFVEAYVEYTHYVEKLHQVATGGGAHDEHGQAAKPPSKAAPGKSRHEH